MNLYLISQSENEDYDTYDSAIVCAPDEETARNTTPDGMPFRDSYPSWATSPEKVHVQLIGEAHRNLTPGVVLASYNAG